MKLLRGKRRRLWGWVLGVGGSLPATGHTDTHGQAARQRRLGRWRGLRNRCFIDGACGGAARACVARGSLTRLETRTKESRVGVRGRAEA